MNTLHLFSPAKINLYLKVLGKRLDGYHDLRMVMTKVSLFDEITLTINNKEISLSCDNPDLPLGTENIAWKAANLFMEENKIKAGLTIDIKKRIPMGGGLGGGSSNAASVLMGLNTLFGSPASQNELMQMALKLGADVPFFIFNGAAVAEGVGEKLSPVKDLPEMRVILLMPGIEVSTAYIFRKLNLGLTKPDGNLTINCFNFELSRVIDTLCNDLEKVTLQDYPQVAEAKDMLIKNGAAGVLMSGSGSTVFGLYKDDINAEIALSGIKRDIGYRCWSACLVYSI